MPVDPAQDWDLVPRFPHLNRAWGSCVGVPCRPGLEGTQGTFSVAFTYLFTKWKYFCRNPGSTALLQSSSCVWG